MDKSVILFKQNNNLSKNEALILKLLIEAGKLIEPIYKLQENPKYPGANFYPHGVSKKEIEMAAKKNPLILDPYTMVEKKDGKLIATPYHEKFVNELKKIADKLIEASKISNNKVFADCLRIQAKALLDGSYDEATRAWMRVKQYILDINIGPVERYDDKLFFRKTSYQAWVGTLDQSLTKQVSEYKDIILSSRRRVLMPSEKVDYYDKVQVRVDDVVLFSGLMARTLFIGVNLPNDVNLMEKYGSEITIFKQVNTMRFKDEILPTFNKIFSEQFKKIFQIDELEKGRLYSVVLHELAHTYLRYRSSEKNLQDLFPVIDELAASVMGIKVCGSLLLKDIMSQKQLESVIVAFITKNFTYLKQLGDPVKSQYKIGGIIFLNYLLENGALKESGGVSWPNFMKIFVCLEELATVLERILSQGKRADAEAIIKKYGSTNKLQKFVKILKS